MQNSLYIQGVLTKRVTQLPYAFTIPCHCGYSRGARYKCAAIWMSGANRLPTEEDRAPQWSITTPTENVGRKSTQRIPPLPSFGRGGHVVCCRPSPANRRIDLGAP